MAQANQLSLRDLENPAENALLSTDGILTAIGTAADRSTFVFTTCGNLYECAEAMALEFKKGCDAEAMSVVECLKVCGDEFYAKTGGTVSFWFAANHY